MCTDEKIQGVGEAPLVARLGLRVSRIVKGQLPAQLQGDYLLGVTWLKG